MIKTYNWEVIEKLKFEALRSDIRRSRLLLHDSRENQIQQMLIVIHQSSQIDMHRHPKYKSESYHIIEGRMRVNYWDAEHGNFFTSDYSVEKNCDTSLFGRHNNGIWHMPYSLTEWTVYLETYDGPFVKEKDVEFIV